MQSLLKMSRGIDAFTTLDGQTSGMADPGRGDRVRHQRDRPQDVRHLVELLARAAMGAVQRRLPAVLAMDAARQRTYPDRYRQQPAAEARCATCIDIVGHVFFLLPLCIVMIITGGPVLPALVRDQRAIGQCRRAAAMAGQIADHDRIRVPAGAGHLRTDQAHRGDARAHSGSARIAGACASRPRSSTSSRRSRRH